MFIRQLSLIPRIKDIFNLQKGCPASPCGIICMRRVVETVTNDSCERQKKHGLTKQAAKQETTTPSLYIRWILSESRVADTRIDHSALGDALIHA